ncbi:hypothetical protein CK215_22710, partial [Mesorhizobium sp. WSM3864]|uniref:Ig-like domain-containing protein n=1 Tax=Mesorhizobium sp. WSM3864 TaxID=2029404 RepID=UPI000BDADCDE
MTTSIEFDAVSNFSDEHATVGEQPISGVISGVQVAQASGGQTAPAAGEPVPVDAGSGAPAKGDGNAQNAQSTAKPAADGNAPAANAPAGNAPAPNTAASNVAHEYHVEAGNVVKLPANVSIDDIKVDGHNLVLVQPDGAEIVIKDGALNVPTFIIGDVEVPRVALIAALEASHVDVAFGADGSISAGGNGSPSSAGGDFSVPPGGIGDGFGLSALLPPTALAFGQPENRDLFPSLLKPDSTPSIGTIGEASVNEAGLPPHGGLPAGSGEIADGDSGNNSNTSETTSGTIGFTSPDGVSQVTLGGHVLTSAAQTFTDATGSLTASYSFDAATGTGTINYSYTLNTNTSGDGTSVSFAVGVTDSDGDAAPPGTLVINIIDDAPTAVADTDAVPSGSHAPIDGNVITGTGSDGNPAGADVKGADDVTVVGVAAGDTGESLDSTTTVGTVIHGTYGDLTLGANGEYSYVRNAGTPGGHDDVFTYTIKDGDGDLSRTTLTISIGDSTPTDTIPTPGGPTTTVYEAGLPARGGESPGSDAAASSETTSGTIGFTSPDGIQTVSLGGHVLTGAPQTFTDATGSLTASYIYNAATGVGSISYTYTLLDNTAGDNTHASFAVVVTDADGDGAPAGNLVINIVDDVPTAHADTNSVTEGAQVSGNVLTDGTPDVSGADGYAATGAVVGVRAANGDTTTAVATGVNTQIVGQYGTLTLHADGSYTYQATANAISANATDTFVYTIKDGDGDLSTTTLAINVANVTLTPVNQTGQVNEAALDTVTNPGDLGHGTVTGSNPPSTAETVAGQLNVAGDGVTYTAISTTTAHGIFQLQANGAWTYTLTSPFDSGATQGANTLTGAESFTYTATDANGNTVTGTVKIDVVDDVPHASADIGNVTEGALLTVTAANGVLSNDVSGADGYAATGAVVGVRAANGDTTTAVATGVNTQIVGQYGTLTLHADGSYTYQATANAISANATDTFVYTIKDGDGDLSTTTLAINVANVTLTPVNQTGQVNEAALDTVTNPGDLGHGTVTGSNPPSTAETVAGQLNVAGDGVTYTAISTTTAHGIFQLQANGAWTYTLTSPFDSGATQGANTLTGAESFTYTATDANGNTVTGTVKIDVVDDVP